ncbi:cytochrome P450 [Mucidula mucida]|nr:cytochrome P450 [Mucidula mucida]
MFSSSAVACTALAALTLAYIVRLIAASRSSTIAKLPIAPVEEADFFLGHEYRVAKGEVDVEYSRWTDLLGPVYRIKAALFQKDIVIISDNLAVQHIFQNAYTYLKSAAFQPIVVKVVGRGVVWAEDEEHKWQRRLLAPAFTPSAVKAMADDVLHCAEKTARRLADDLESRGSGIVNLTTYIPPCTLEVIGRVGFGYDFGYNTPEAKAILEAWQQDVALFATFPAFLAPILIGVFPWISKLPIKELHEDSTAKKTIHRVGRQLMKQAINPEGKDIFSILVRESWQEKEGGKERTKLDDHTLLDNILSFFMAGFETSSGVIVFTLLDLAQNLELNPTPRGACACRFHDGESRDSSLLDAVAREGLRLHPTARDTHRIAAKDDVIPLQNPITLKNGKTITSLPVKAGDGFTIPFTVMNTNSKIWGRDGDKFIPERWLSEGGVPSGKDLPHGPFSNVSTFADGPRMCLGWRLAVMEVKFIIAVMIKSFEFKDSGAKIEKIISPSLQPFVNGEAAMLPIHITPVHSHSK